MVKASILLPLHNVAPYLETCLSAALNQTLSDFELIAVDDASNDGSAEILERVARQDSRLRVVTLARNGGVSVARNVALKEAKGEWIVLIDGDDWMERDRVARMIDAAEKLGADWIADDQYFVRDEGKGPPPRLFVNEPPGARLVEAPHVVARDVPGHHGYGLLKPVISRAFIDRHRVRYRPDLRIHGDFFFFVECAAHGAKIALLNEPLYWYRLRKGSVSKGDPVEIATTMKGLSTRERTVARELGQTALEQALARREQLIDLELAYYHTIAPLKRRRPLASAAVLAKNLFAVPYVARKLWDRVRHRVNQRDTFELVLLSNANIPETEASAPTPAPEMPRHAVDQHPPEKPAVIMGGSGQAVTYGELTDRSRRLARFFRAQGLKPGDHIATVLENRLAWYEIFWGAIRSGLYHTPINWHLHPDEAAYVVRDCGAKLLFVSNAVADAVGDLAQGLTVVNVDAPASDPSSYAQCLAGSAAPLDDEREGQIMFYSSGTTGRPKGIKRPLSGEPYGQPGKLMQQMIAGLSFGLDMVYLSPAPLYHAAPSLWSNAVLRVGGTVICMERFDPLETLELIQRYKVTHAQFVPTMFIRMLKLPEEDRRRFDVSSLKVVIHAAAPCPVDVKRAMIDWFGPIIHEYYSASEGIGRTEIDSADWLAHPGSVGKAKAGIVHVLGEDGNECPPGTPGLIYFEGQGDFAYHNDPDKTAEAHLPNGWATVGDMGYLDTDGYLYLTDRKAHMIISGGVNIYPQEIEAVLTGHPDVDDVAVIGVPNPDFGEEVKAVVVPGRFAHPGPALEETLITYCRGRMGHFKCPKTVDFVTELPRLPTGKLLKRQLRERYLAK